MNKLLPSNAFHFLSLHGWKVTKLVVRSFNCEFIWWLVVGRSVFWVVKYFCRSVVGSFGCEIIVLRSFVGCQVVWLCGHLAMRSIDGRSLAQSLGLPDQ